VRTLLRATRSGMVSGRVDAATFDFGPPGCGLGDLGGGSALTLVLAPSAAAAAVGAAEGLEPAVDLAAALLRVSASSTSEEDEDDGDAGAPRSCTGDCGKRGWWQRAHRWRVSAAAEGVCSHRPIPITLMTSR
jgi:hypothetical protein